MKANLLNSRRLIQFLSFFIITTSAISLTSCAVAPDEMEMLDRATRAYERAFRWGDFARAKTYHMGETALSDLERRRLQLYKITGYDLLQVDTPDRFNSYVVVEVKYYKESNASVKTIVVKQHWKRDKDSQHWYLTTKFPNLR